jgi:hypothetical protein
VPKDGPKRKLERDPAWVHTSRDGRKFIRSNEIVHLERFQQQVEKLKRLTKPGSRLVKDGSRREARI